MSFVAVKDTGNVSKEVRRRADAVSKNGSPQPYAVLLEIYDRRTFLVHLADALVLQDCLHFGKGLWVKADFGLTGVLVKFNTHASISVSVMLDAVISEFLPQL